MWLLLCTFIVSVVGWQEKPEESREYKGEWREDKKKRNMQNRVLHSVEGGFKKNKPTQRPKNIFLTPREPIEASWELLTYKLVRKNRKQKCRTSMPMANNSCSRHELALPAAPCCSEMSASDALGTHLECTTETCPGHLRDQTPWALHSSAVPAAVSAWSCVSG